VNLNDMGDRASKRAGLSPSDVARENRGITDYLNAVECKVARRKDLTPREDTARALTALIPTPAKLRRDVTRALRSPDLTLNHRHETRGRFDMRDVSRAQAGATSVFRRREEALGENAAVSFLIDLSTSMRGSCIEATTALALHLGDACKASNVPFEVLGFLSPPPRARRSAQPTSILMEVKSFRDPWQEARPYVASLIHAPKGGTSMMPAMIDVAKRLRAKAGVSRRVMLVLTDGEDGWSAGSARAAAKTALTRDGVETLVIGALTDVKHLGLPYVNVTSLRELATQGLEALGEALAVKRA
jgi:cobalamin biosynthesis protein CobT